MNYKLLFPTYRNRYRFVRQKLQQYRPVGGWANGLNLGTGEGDYDWMIAKFCQQLEACDINEDDVAFAQWLNQDVTNLKYRVADALNLVYEDDAFDLLVSVDVLEHVGQPEGMMREVGRVLKPGGIALMTFPNLRFPVTYDPLNRLFRRRRLAQGAYAFGHNYLIDADAFRGWAAENDLLILDECNLSGYLIGFLEMYWTGWVQRLLKANATNLSEKKKRRLSLRPSREEPLLTIFTDGVIKLDHRFSGKSRHSVGKGFVLKKLR